MDSISNADGLLAHINLVELVIAVILLYGVVFVRSHLAIPNCNRNLISCLSVA
jgi:hypothetical protein